MQKELKRVTEVIGSGDIEFHPELPRMDFEDILGDDWIIRDVQIMKGWETEFGKSDWCLIQLAKPDVEGDEGFTTKCGGKVLTKRLTELKAGGHLPIIGKFVMKGEGDRQYFQVI